jgi:hypothetical protein
MTSCRLEDEEVKTETRYRSERKCPGSYKNFVGPGGWRTNVQNPTCRELWNSLVSLLRVTVFVGSLLDQFYQSVVIQVGDE